MLAFLLKLRVRVQQSMQFSDAHSMLLWAALAGMLGALATIVFREGIRLLQWLVTGHSGSLVEMARHLPWPARIALPAGGGLCAGLMVWLAKRYPARVGDADYMEAIVNGDGRVNIRQTLLRSFSSLCSIASGGSIGREGAMVQLAALCASVTGRVVHLDPQRLRLLVACGAAAGISAAYNAPVAGAFFVTEIVLGSIAMENFGPLVVASVIANIAMRELPGYKPVYEMPPFAPIAGVEMPLFIVLGILAGLVAPQFLRLIDAARRAFARSRLPLPLRLGAGGLLVGIISVWVPQVWGNGYSVVNTILHEPWAPLALLTVLLSKIVATACTVGSGAVGGVLTPVLFVGAALGCLFGQMAHLVWPALGVAPFMFAMVGMGAFLAAATSAPLMAILMIFEMTLSYSVMLPLILASIAAYFVARASGASSMYAISLRRMLAAQATTRLKSSRMRELVMPADTVLREDAPFSDMTRMFFEYPVKYIYVVDHLDRFLGAVPLQSVTSALLEGRDPATMRAGEFVQTAFPTLTPDMALGDALEHFIVFKGERLPVVQEAGDPLLVGVAYKTSLLDIYVRLSEPERDRGAVA